MTSGFITNSIGTGIADYNQYLIYALESYHRYGLPMFSLLFFRVLALYEAFMHTFNALINACVRRLYTGMK